MTNLLLRAALIALLVYSLLLAGGVGAPQKFSTKAGAELSLPPQKNLNFIEKWTLHDPSTAERASPGVTFDDTPPLPGFVDIVDSANPSLESPKIEFQQFNNEISAVWGNFVENDTSHPVVPTFDCIVKTSTNGQCRSYFGYNNAESSYLHAPAGSDINRFTGGDSSSYDGQPSLFEPGEHRYVFSVVHTCSAGLTWKLDALAVSTEWDNVETCPAGCDGVRLSGATKDACGVCKGNNGTCTNIEPFVSCVRVFPDKTCAVSFGYHNKGHYTVKIPAGSSSNLIQGALTKSGDQGQPTVFYKGRYSGVVSVLFDCSDKKADLDWHLNGRMATAKYNHHTKKRNLCKGCDGVRGSTKVRDRCGVCGGDGSSCADQPTRNQTTTNLGIARYEVALGASATDTTSLVVPFTDVSVSNRYTFTELTLQNKRYYVHVKAFNQAGLATLVTSDPVQADTTPPIAAAIYDGSQFRTDAAYQSSLTEISANWPDVIDPDSGIDSYTFGVGTSPGEYDVLPEISVGVVTSYTAGGLSLQVGTTYFVNIVATNKAGLETDELSSNGITVIVSPPEAGTIYDGLESGIDASYQASQTTISAHWSGFRDSRVGIREFRCGVGTSSSSADVVGFVSVGLHNSHVFQLPGGSLLQNGVKYFFIVQAVSNIFLSTTKASNGIIVDATPPIAGTLKDGNGKADFTVQTSTTTFTGQWTSFSDPETGIQEYRCGLSSDSTGNPDVAAFRTVSSEMRSCTFTNLGMSLGKIFYFTVEGVNSVGMSVRGVSDGVSIIASRGSCKENGECVCDDGWSGPFCSVGIPNVSPILDCFLDNCDGSRTAYFGYNNLNPDVITIPVGNNNKATPVPFDQGQPTLFQVGRHHYQFNRTASSAEMTWQIGQSVAVANLNSIVCGWQKACQTVPGAPTALIANYINSTTVLLAWSAPSSDGGAAISDYRVTCASSNANSITVLLVGAAHTTLSVSGLAHATTFTFTVAAKNKIGFSTESAPLSATTSPIVPSAPISLSPSLISPTTISLNWATPTLNGGASITNYRITYSLSGGAAETVLVGGVSTSFTLISLVHGKQYTITVSAQNTAGWSAESAPVTAITLTTPGYPRNLHALNITTSSILLTWEPPTTTGGSAIINYRISYVTQGNAVSPALSGNGSMTSYTIEGLNPGAMYNITVAAQNSVGFSAESTAVVVSTFPIVPSSPETLNIIRITSSTVDLTWSPPSYTGGATVTNYRISYSAPNGAQLTAVVSHQVIGATLSNLQPGTQYTITVAAKNAAGWSNESSTAIATTLATIPAAPTNLKSSSVTSSSISLNWNTPLRDGGAPVTEYQIVYAVSGSSVHVVLTGSSSPSFLLVGLHFATYYIITVAAVNSAGISQQSTAVWITTSSTIPTAPQSVSVSSFTSTEVSLSWEAPISDGGSSIENYRLTYSTSGHPSETVIAGGTCTSYVISGLLPGTHYSASIAAENSVGFSPESAAVTFTTQSVPSVPTSLSADSITAYSISLSWSAPLSDGLATITDYRVTFTAFGGSTLASFVGSANTSIVLHCLTPGRKYSITVAAKNSVGFSMESDAITPTTAAIVPKPPTNLTISSATSHSLDLSWSAPQSDGGSAIVSYRITYTPSGGSPITVFTDAAEISYALSSLDPGVDYTITVAAQNGVGFSNESSAASLTTTATTPGQPLSLAATSITSTNISLSWSAPLSDGGAALSDYLITFGLSGDGPRNSVYVGQPATTFTLTALRSGAEYSVTVTAINPLGFGPESDATMITTNDGPPSAPTGFIASAVQTTSVSLSWLVPECNGGDDITEYRITHIVTGEAPVETLTGNTNLELVLTDLQPGTEYTLSVAAKNGAGFSEESVSISVTTQVAVPSAPTDLNASSVTKNSIQVDWNAPRSSGGATLSHYRISYSSSTVFVAASTTSYTIVNLASGASYTITVAANNTAGWSQESAPVSPVTLTVPPPPFNVTISEITSSSMAVVWAVPESDGGAPVLSYMIYYQAEHQTSSAVAFSNESSVVLTELHPGTVYNITVAAKNSIGLSEPGNSSIATTIAVVPDTPHSLDATAISATGINVSWTVPSYTGGAPVSDYRITVTDFDANQSTSMLVGGPGTSFSLTGLNRGSEYSITVAAANSIGFSLESISASATTWDFPSAPSSVSILFVTSRSLGLGWSRPTFLGGGSAGITDYRVTWTDATTEQTFTNNTGSGSITEIELTDLNPNTVYVVTISAANSVGFGPESDSIAPSTNIELPGVPRFLRASAVRKSSMNISWDEPLWNGGAALTDYIVIFVAHVPEYTGMFVVFTGSGSVRTIMLEHLSPETDYSIVVAAKNPLGSGETSDEVIFVRTLADDATPNDDISYIEHGQCSNDTCVCNTGYHGENCGQTYNDVVPVLISVLPNGDGTSLAWFGYENTAPFAQNISAGTSNYFSTPIISCSGLPLSFEQGSFVEAGQPGTFTVVFDEDQGVPIWNLGSANSADSQVDNRGYVLPNGTLVCLSKWRGPDCSIGMNNVVPSLVSVVSNGDGTSKATFNYTSTNVDDIEIPIGPFNYFEPEPADRGQPTVFIGDRSVIVTITFNDSDSLPIWHLGASIGGSGIPNGYCLSNGSCDCSGNETCEVAIQRVTPILLKIVPVLGTDILRAYFGYHNQHPYSVVIPVGDKNRVYPTPLDETGLPTSFQPGLVVEGAGVFFVEFSGSEIPRWKLGNGTAQVTPMNGTEPGKQTHGFCNGSQCQCFETWSGSDCSLGIANVGAILTNVSRVDTTDKSRAYFGYISNNTATITVPIGEYNYFVPGPPNRGQVVEFTPGRADNVFIVEFETALGIPVWIIGNHASNESQIELPDDGDLGGGNDNDVLPDTTPPVPGLVLDGPINNIDVHFTMSMNSLFATWSGFGDLESGINRYLCAAGTTRLGTDVVDYINVGRATKCSFYGLTLTESVRYYMSVMAFNGVMLSTSVSSNGVIVENTPPLPGAIYNGPNAGVNIDVQYSNTTLDVSWDEFSDPESGISRYSCGVTTVLGFNDETIPMVTVIDGQRSYHFSSLSLNYGDTYFFVVEAQNGAGMKTVAFSNPLSVIHPRIDNTSDTTPPRAGIVNDGPSPMKDLEFQTDNVSSLSGTWLGFRDPDSAIRTYHVGVGTSSSTSNVVPLRDVGIVNTYTFTNLSLTNGVKYYFIVQAFNRDNLSTMVSSNGVTIDTTPPVKGSVFNGLQTGKDLTFQVSSSTISAHWFSFEDPESGVYKYRCGVGTSVDKLDFISWTDVGTATKHTFTALSLTQSVKYYFVVEATNGAGMKTIVSSSGVTLDYTPPVFSFITPDAANIEPTISYSNSTVSFGGVWSAFDPETDIAGYRCGIGTKSTIADLVPLLNIGLNRKCEFSTPDGYGELVRTGFGYYLIVEAVNGAGVTTLRASRQVFIDNTPPNGTVNHGLQSLSDGEDLKNQVAEDTLSARWNITDEDSGVFTYQFGIGSSRFSDDVLPFRDVGLVNFYTATNLALIRNSVYYVTIKAINKAFAAFVDSPVTGVRIGTIGVTTSATETTKMSVTEDKFDMDIEAPPGLLPFPVEIVARSLKPEDFANDPELEKPSSEFVSTAMSDQIPASPTLAFTLDAFGVPEEQSNQSLSFLKPLTIRLSYAASGLDEKVDPANLMLKFWDPSEKRWQFAKESCPTPYEEDFPEEQLHVVNICHFTQFALFGKNIWAPYLLFGGIASAIGIFMFIMLSSVFLLTPLFLIFALYRKVLRYLNHRRISPQAKGETFAVVPKSSPVAAGRRASVSARGRGGGPARSNATRRPSMSNPPTNRGAAGRRQSEASVRGRW